MLKRILHAVHTWWDTRRQTAPLQSVDDWASEARGRPHDDLPLALQVQLDYVKPQDVVDLELANRIADYQATQEQRSFWETTTKSLDTSPKETYQPFNEALLRRLKAFRIADSAHSYYAPVNPDDLLPYETIHHDYCVAKETFEQLLT